MNIYRIFRKHPFMCGVGGLMLDLSLVALIGTGRPHSKLAYAILVTLVVLFVILIILLIGEVIANGLCYLFLCLWKE